MCVGEMDFLCVFGGDLCFGVCLCGLCGGNVLIELLFV